MSESDEYSRSDFVSDSDTTGESSFDYDALENSFGLPVDPVGDLRWSGTICEKLLFSWKINNFSTLQDFVGATYYSDPVPVLDAENFFFTTELYPGGRTREEIGIVELRFVCTNQLGRRIPTKLDGSIRNSNNEIIAGEKNENWVMVFPGINPFILKVPKRILLAKLEDDIFIFKVEIIYNMSMAKVFDRTRTITLVSPFVNFAEDYSNLPNRMDTDVVILVEGTEFLAHSAVLRVRSKTLGTMLDQAEVEGGGGRIAIVDCTAYQMKAVLQFMYSGTVNELNQLLALELIQVGQKLHMDGLIGHCSVFLTGNMNKYNVESVLFYADSRPALADIRDRAIEHIIDSVSYDDLKNGFAELKENTELVFAIILRMMERRGTPS